MPRTITGNVITVETATKLTLHRFAQVVAGPLWQLSGGGSLVEGIVVGVGHEDKAPYTAQIQIDGIGQVESDGTTIIAVGDTLRAGATGYCEKYVEIDGLTIRQWAGIALSAATNTAGLLVDVLLQRWSTGG